MRNWLRFETAMAVLLAAGMMWDAASAEDLAIDLSGADAAKQWVFSDENGRIADGELVLDGRQKMSRAFFTPLEWNDVTLRAEFMVEPADEGVLACGFVVRAQDAATHYYVHFDRTQAILVRSDPDASWHEIKRKSGLHKPAGQWHSGQLRAVGDTLTVPPAVWNAQVGGGNAEIAMIPPVKVNDICDTSYISVTVDYLGDAALDCNTNGVPDECETDCNNNSVPDDCDISAGTSEDCQPNGVPDECDVLSGASVARSCSTSSSEIAVPQDQHQLTR